MFGAPAAGGVQGTTIAAYAPTTEKDTTSNTMVTIHNISAMPQVPPPHPQLFPWQQQQQQRQQRRILTARTRTTAHAHDTRHTTVQRQVL
jgi:hypothetical protein